ncbi:MAG TPA: thiamine diphosphokinase [Candidatus Krumholzibacteria bacterium]|nr:thiamine diphosphokinase [Candidatus Krumholzibacteria bacterium]HPD70661.1 thiamine diphosphokinase [Candidatus Krumholzibacteria bacterium]HRY39639.1 thiamine diphosphokinase [Candidatus Krumholzibacteria bacterium]
MSLYDLETGGAACPIFPKKGPRAVILCDGPPPPPGVLEYWLGGADLFVCTDAAGHPYDELPVPPQIVIGDFDALAGRVLDGRAGPKFLRVDEQETTDSEKALLYLLDQGFTEAVLVGAVGWRLDHTLYNTMLLERFAGRMRLAIAGLRADGVRLAPGQTVSWSLDLGTNFSLLPLRGQSRGVTIDGAKYPLLDGDLGPDGVGGISNRVTYDPLLIRAGDGPLLVLVDREPAGQHRAFEE